MGRWQAAFLIFCLMAAGQPRPRQSVRTSRPAPARATVAKAAAPPAARKQAGQSIARRWLQSLSLREQIAQLIVIVAYGDNPSSRSKEYREFAHAVRDLRVGGIIVNNRVVNGTVRAAEPYAMATFLNRMQRLAKVPLMIAGDFERGASMRVNGTTKYPHNMAFGAAHDVALSRYEGLATAREARAIGVHWVFAPDADVNNNPDNPIINIRSYGEDPELVSAHVRAYIEGAHSDPQNRVLVTAKHFPGHGDTNVDSHLGLASLGATREHMNEVELAPFRAAIAAHVDAIMTAHMAVPAIEPEEIPATVSTRVLTGLLRNDLRYQGLIVTDAMDMQGLAKQFPSGEASVRALQAGADVLLMPPRPEEAINAVYAAVQRGQLTRERIAASALKFLSAKVEVGLQHSRFVELEAIGEAIDSADAAERAQETASRALTLLKNEQSVLPLKANESACLFVLAEGRYSQQGRRLLEEVRRWSPSLKQTWLDPTASTADLATARESTATCGKVVVAAFATASAYKGTIALPGSFSGFVNDLVKGPAPVAFIAFGNPYLLRSFPDVRAYVATFSTVPYSEVAVARALFGEIGFAGKSPVSIPGFAKIGDGLTASR